MADGANFGNALVAALQRQRNGAQDLCAKAEANVAVLEADNARLAAENAKLHKEAKEKPDAVNDAPEVNQGEE